MPTPFTHIAIPIAVTIGAGFSNIPKRLLLAGIILSILPDLDVISFKFGIAYANILGHRGLSHSLVFALGTAILTAFLLKCFRVGFIKAFAFLLVAALSHTLLDMLTNGGLGVALFWPWSETRFLSPVRPIVAAPFAVSRLFSAHGIPVFRSEFHWVWLPALTIAVIFAVGRFIGRKTR